MRHLIAVLVVTLLGFVSSADDNQSAISSTGNSPSRKSETTESHDQRLIDFDTQIIPILTRQGCNAGSCHGAALGRGGFKLSLFGSDAKADHIALAHQLQGRRVNLHDPERSLALLKASEQVGHEGGMRLEEDSDFFATMRSWIQQGAKRRQLRRLSRLVIDPSDVVLTESGKSVDVTVNAYFDDGSAADVTNATVFTADDPDAVRIDDETRRFTVSRSGVHVVIARYLDQVRPIRLTVPRSVSPGAQPPAQERQASNEIDALINRQLDQLQLPSSPPVDGGRLLRRLTLDLAGRLPTADEFQTFQQRPDVTATIDRLLNSDDFAQYWAFRWANVLQIDSKQLQPQGAFAFHKWLKEQIAADASITSMARAMLTTTGDSFAEGPANFLRTGNSPGDLAEHVTQVFMGARMRCANCHNHPLDHWTQDDYHGLAAIFAKVSRGRVVSLSDRGAVTHPVTGQPALPRIPGERFLSPDDNGLLEFADWLTDESNPYLARVTTNRIWQQLMGRGLVQPVDDLRATNLATNPELLDWFSQELANQGFRMKPIIRSICLSAAYQRSSNSVAGNESDTVFYSRTLQRPLAAEVFADAVGDVTGVPLEYQTATSSGDSVSSMTRAIAITDNHLPSNILDALGRCDRTQSCATGMNGSDASGNPLARALHLINGPLINSRVSNPSGRLADLLDRQPDNFSVLDQLYVIALGHPAGDREIWQQRFDEAELDSVANRKAFFEDVLWSLLSSETFGTNH